MKVSLFGLPDEVVPSMVYSAENGTADEAEAVAVLESLLEAVLPQAVRLTARTAAERIVAILFIVFYLSLSVV